LELDAAGWAVIAELVTKGCKAGIKLTPDRIRRIVAVSDKNRFSISEDGLRIRANQGHSLAIDLGFEKAEPPQLLYHGTPIHHLLAIRHQGLIKGNRQYVHLSVDKETAEDVGRRYGKPVVLTIKAALMHKDGFKFFLSANGVWLTDNVPPEYITGHKKDRK
jgi:putative RNA 2'-phosphotransferase